MGPCLTKCRFLGIWGMTDSPGGCRGLRDVHGEPLRVGSALASHLSHGPPKRWLPRRGDSENARVLGGKGLNRGVHAQLVRAQCFLFFLDLALLGFVMSTFLGTALMSQLLTMASRISDCFFLGKGLLLTAKLCEWNRPVLSESFQPRSCYVACPRVLGWAL